MKETRKATKRMYVILAISFLATLIFTACNNKIGSQDQINTEVTDVSVTSEAKVTSEATETEEPAINEKEDSIILATTTSTQDSGLLDYILPKFTEQTGIEVKVVAVGTGQAIQMGVDGEADVLLVHAKASEEEFIKAGHAAARFDVMYNDFVLLGPEEDPAGITDKAEGNIIKAFTILNEGNYTFVSRGDDSGTDKKEKSIWKEVTIEPQGDWYLSAGKGMGDVILMTNEKLGYTLGDRATFLAMQDKIDLKIVLESDTLLLNQYGVIAVDPNKNELINGEGATAFVHWILSEDTQKLIGEFGIEEFGQALFTPNAQE